MARGTLRCHPLFLASRGWHRLHSLFDCTSAAARPLRPPSLARSRAVNAGLAPLLCLRWLQDGLSSRGFTVTRLNTYDTVPVGSIAPEVRALDD